MSWTAEKCGGINAAIRRSWQGQSRVRPSRQLRCSAVDTAHGLSQVARNPHAFHLFRNHRWKLVLLALLCGALGSCTDLYYYGPGATLGGTRYLEGYTPGDPRYCNQQVDTESWWRGDGVPGESAITLSLRQQKAYFYKGDRLVGVSLISSGDPDHPTPRGSFTVQQKDRWHQSSQYGDYVDASGNPDPAEYRPQCGSHAARREFRRGEHVLLHALHPGHRHACGLSARIRGIARMRSHAAAHGGDILYGTCTSALRSRCGNFPGARPVVHAPGVAHFAVDWQEYCGFSSSFQACIPPWSYRLTSFTSS